MYGHGKVALQVELQWEASEHCFLFLPLILQLIQTSLKTPGIKNQSRLVGITIKIKYYENMVK
jgi:hypothetical protein